MIPTDAMNPLTMFTGTQTLTGGLPVTASGRTLTFYRVGEYLVVLSPVGTTIGNTLPTLGGTATITALSPEFMLNGAATDGECCFRVSVLNPAQTTLFDITAAFGTCTAVAVRVGPYAYSNA